MDATPQASFVPIAPLKAKARTDDYDLSNVTPETVVSILKGVRTGKLDQIDRLFRLMLESWPRLAKATAEVSAAVRSIPLEIIPATREGQENPTPAAQRVADVVSRALESFAPLPTAWELGKDGMIDALLDARPKGFVALEILWHVQNGIVSPRCYCPLPGRFIAWPRNPNEVDRLMLARDGNSYGALVDFDADNYIIAKWGSGSNHPIHAGLLRPLAKYWLGSVYGLGWLMQFAQLFGIPWRHVETDGTDAAIQAAKNMLATIGSSGAAVTGQGVKLNVLNGVTASGATLPQSHLMNECDRACDILLLGQSLTTDVGSSGSRALGDVHAGVRADMLQGIATWLASVVTDQLIPAIVRANFGTIPAEDMPFARMNIPEAKDIKAAAEGIKAAKDAGLDVPRKWAHEHVGIPEPMDDEDEIEDDESQSNQQDMQDDDAEPEDTRPTEEMARNAEAMLTAADHGSILTVATRHRARDIANRVELSAQTIAAMKEWFDRVDLSKLDTDKHLKAAYYAHGGEAGQAWVQSMAAKMQ